MTDSALSSLFAAARKVRDRAYAPYSSYCVGAAILTASGDMYTGVNVENISYGLTICAERNAVGQWAASSRDEIVAVAVSTVDGGTPCGACRQVLAEFIPPQRHVYCLDNTGSYSSYTIGELLPLGFQSSHVSKQDEE